MIRFRVVWGLWVVMAILSPTTLLMSVDFPTLGLPMMPMKPDLNTDVSFLYRMMTGIFGNRDPSARWTFFDPAPPRFAAGAGYPEKSPMRASGIRFPSCAMVSIHESCERDRPVPDESCLETDQ
jgi:hypothetical protein